MLSKKIVGLNDQTVLLKPPLCCDVRSTQKGKSIVFERVWRFCNHKVYTTCNALGMYITISDLTVDTLSKLTNF